MDEVEALRRLRTSRVARLATLRPEGSPHLVPVTFAFVGEHIVTMIDHKPKTTTSLQRLANVEKSPHASLIVDHYSDDWSELWWVRVDGHAMVHNGGELWVEGRQALAAKYRQYEHRPPDGPAIAIRLDHLSFWASTA